MNKSGKFSTLGASLLSPGAREAVLQKESPTTSDGRPSFIKVKFGDDEDALFNPWCSVSALMECMRRRCKCDEEMTIDLVDLQGQIKNLSSKSSEYAYEYVSGRETYVLIKIEKQGENEPCKYVPLLNNLDKFSPDLMLKLHQMSRPPSKFGKSKWGVMSKKGMKMGLGGSGKAKDAVPASPGANTNDKKKNILQKIGFLQPT